MKNETPLLQNPTKTDVKFFVLAAMNSKKMPYESAISLASISLGLTKGEVRAMLLSNYKLTNLQINNSKIIH